MNNSPSVIMINGMNIQLSITTITTTTMTIVGAG
jgi:hypothetical protein